VQIEWIALCDFRSYAALSYSPSSTLNVVTGSNGQGKTNLLEALGLLLVGRSFRGAKAQAYRRHPLDPTDHRTSGGWSLGGNG
jgi:DNA replication and repair protein RecF